MGYDTYFNGELTITPTMTPEHFALVRHILGLDYDYSKTPPYPDPSTVPPIPENLSEIAQRIAKNQWEDRLPFELRPEAIADTGGATRAYEAEDVTKLLIEEIFPILGYVVEEGSISWSGDDSEDHGEIHANGNKVEWVADVCFNPGPSWNPQKDWVRAKDAA